MTDDRPRCSDHPDQLSAGTCARCGRFACVSCWRPDTGHCAACEPKAADALGIARPFSIGHVLGSAWRLTRATAPMLIAVSVLMTLASIAIQNLPLLSGAEAMRAEGLPGALIPVLVSLAGALVVSTLLSGILLAQMSAVARGEAISAPAAVWRGTLAYPRLFWAQFVATVLTLLGSLACGVPGIYAAVVLSLVLPVAYLDPDSPAAETSADLVHGKRLQMLVLLLFPRTIVLATVAFPVLLTRALAGDAADLARLGMASDASALVLGLVRSLVESFTVAMMLAAYLSLRSDAERPPEVDLSALAALTSQAPATAPAPLFRKV